MYKQVVAVAVTAIILKLLFFPSVNFNDEDRADSDDKISESVPKFWLYHKTKNEFVFKSIEKVLTMLGLEKIEVNATNARSISYDWDVLWSFDYMSVLPLKYYALKAYQRINHIPGIFHITSKSRLTTTTQSKYVPKGFESAEDLKAFAAENPEVRFVQKLKANRGVSLKNISEIDFTNTHNANTDYFAQVFVEDPLLLDGHKFDLAVFVAITSVDPLRVYYYSKSYNMRVCRLPYDPTNFEETDSYVVGDNFTPIFDFPQAQKYFNRSYLAKDAFHTYLKKNGHDPKYVDDQIEDCIHEIVSSYEHKFIHHINELRSKYGKIHFFELVRFDFILDAKLQLHLMEVNLSPNLSANTKIRSAEYFFENVIYNFLNLVGVGTHIEKRHIRKFEVGEENVYCHVNSLTVSPEVCMESPCIDSCEAVECELCWNCLSAVFTWDLRMAYLEHMNMGDFKRVVPPATVKAFYFFLLFNVT